MKPCSCSYISNPGKVLILTSLTPLGPICAQERCHHNALQSASFSFVGTSQDVGSDISLFSVCMSKKKIKSVLFVTWFSYKMLFTVNFVACSRIYCTCLTFLPLPSSEKRKKYLPNVIPFRRVFLNMAQVCRKHLEKSRFFKICYVQHKGINSLSSTKPSKYPGMKRTVLHALCLHFPCTGEFDIKKNWQESLRTCSDCDCGCG